MGKRFRMPETSYSCSICKRSFGKGSHMHECRICNWDACSRCFTKSYNPKTVKTTMQGECHRTGMGKHSKVAEGTRGLACVAPSFKRSNHATLICLSILFLLSMIFVRQWAAKEFRDD